VKFVGMSIDYEFQLWIHCDVECDYQWYTDNDVYSERTSHNSNALGIEGAK
jgi:hypothetical protein